jgi:hypothetical protein
MSISFVSALYTISAGAEPLYSFTAHEVASLKWGTGTGQVALTKVPANNFAPPSLAVNNTGTTFYLLDSANQRIAVIKNNQFSSIPLSIEGADDFCLSNNNYFHVLFNDKVVRYNQAGQIIKTYPMKGDITPISIQCPLIIEGFDGLFYHYNKNEPLQFIPIGQYAFSIEQNSGSQWMIHRQDNKTGARRKIAIDSRFGSIETLNIIGVDKKGNIYLTVEEMDHKDHTDEKVFRLLRKYTPSGELLAETELPYSLYAYTLKDLVVTPLGEVFQMLPFPDSLKIIKWQQTGYSKTFAKDNLTQWLYVGEADDFEPSETLADETALDETAQFEKPQTTKGWYKGITRRQVMRKARKYVRYRFKVKKSNITKGIYDNNKKLVITPISKRGRYTGMPYKWGGNDTLYSFKRGLRRGKKAGDKCAARCSGKYFGSNLAVGVDCSGFISRVWGLKGKHSTSTLPRISKKLRSKHHLKPGDILNKRGHVRLFTHKSARRFFVYEATGSHNIWKVVRRSYRLSQLRRYKPYRYKGMITNTQKRARKKTRQQPVVKTKKYITTQIKQPQTPKNTAIVKLWLNHQRQVTTHDNVTFSYKINGLEKSTRVYLTLFNISPQGKRSILVDNEPIEVGELYTFPRPTPWQPGQLYKREMELYLEAGRESFKAVVTSSPIKWSKFFAAETAETVMEFEHILGVKELVIKVH